MPFDRTSCCLKTSLKRQNVKEAEKRVCSCVTIGVVLIAKKFMLYKTFNF